MYNNLNSIENQFFEKNFTLKNISTGQEYIFIEQLGKGSEGIVYKGQVKITNELVAIKISYPFLQMEKMENFKQIQFEHVVNVRDMILYNQYVFVIMDYADGEFYKYMQTNEYKNKTKEEKNELFLQVFQLLIQIVKGVEELHKLNLIHRDIKPENILYFRQQNGILLKLCDFGLLKNSTDLRKTPNIGTPYYWAPEIISDFTQTFYTDQVDIWALGMLWYEMIVGQPLLNAFVTVQSIKTHVKRMNQQWINQLIDDCQVFDIFEKELLKTKVLLVQTIPNQRINATKFISEIEILQQKRNEQKKGENAINQITQYQEQIEEAKNKMNDLSSQLKQAEIDLNLARLDNKKYLLQIDQLLLQNKYLESSFQEKEKKLANQLLVYQEQSKQKEIQLKKQKIEISNAKYEIEKQQQNIQILRNFPILIFEQTKILSFFSSLYQEFLQNQINFTKQDQKVIDLQTQLKFYNSYKSFICDNKQAYQKYLNECVEMSIDRNKIIEFQQILDGENQKLEFFDSLITSLCQNFQRSQNQQQNEAQFQIEKEKFNVNRKKNLETNEKQFERIDKLLNQHEDSSNQALFLIKIVFQFIKDVYLEVQEIYREDKIKTCEQFKEELQRQSKVKFKLREQQQFVEVALEQFLMKSKNEL